MATETQEGDATALVVGAGPVGMSAALALDARGVSTAILEAEPADRDRPGSRADYVHGATLEILDGIHPDLGHRIVDAGLLCPVRRTCWRGRELYSRTFPTDVPAGELPHSTRIPQTDVENFLLEALAAREIPIHWDTPVDAVATDAGGVTVEVEEGAPWQAAFLVGADGGSSTVRKAIGADMSGTESANTFVIIDVEERPESPLPSELTFHYQHPGVDHRNVLTAPFQGGWRIDVTCRTSDDPAVVSSDESVREIVSATLGQAYANRVSWVSSYRFKQVVADRFIDEHGRVLLVGDAAHLFAPFGGRGMNSGIHDADAAASAIATASQAKYPPVAHREVENFARLREKAAEWNEYAAGKALEHIYSKRLLPNLKKRVAAAMSQFWPPAGAWLDTAHFGPQAGPPIPTKGKF